MGNPINRDVYSWLIDNYLFDSHNVKSIDQTGKNIKLKRVAVMV